MIAVSYVWLANDAGFSSLDVDGVVLAGGLGIGGRLVGESGFAFIPSFRAQVQHARGSASFGGVSGTGSDTYGAFAGGLTLAFGSMFFGPRISITTQDQSDPVFGAVLGVAF